MLWLTLTREYEDLGYTEEGSCVVPRGASVCFTTEYPTLPFSRKGQQIEARGVPDSGARKSELGSQVGLLI